MNIRGTDFVLFPVTDLAVAARFYREVLGLRQDIYSEEWQWAEFACGNLTLVLQGGQPAPSGSRLALAVEDVSAALAELTARGVRVIGGLQDHGVCEALELPDPDGNVILLHHRADSTFG